MSHSIEREPASLSAGCRHHWVIETPNGSVSAGYCKLCGVNREFRNSNEDIWKDGDSFSLGGSRNRGGSKAASAN